MKKLITPENIVHVTPRMRVLIGTNEGGHHGSGIARVAYDNWGLTYGHGFGPCGNCFGLPTKDWFINTLPIDVIENYVDRYKHWVKGTLDKHDHYITKVGCGLAGYTVPDISPIFESFLKFKKGVWFPQDFLDFYDGKYTEPAKEELTIKETDDGDNNSKVGYGRTFGE